MAGASGIRRYNAIAVALHWVIGLSIIWMLCLGYWMNSDMVARGDRTGLIQLHKSVGIVILWLVVVRIYWRQTHKLPKWPDSMGTWERRAAALGHLALYALMIAMPLSGWAMVSSSPTGLPTFLFKTWHWPHMPFAEGNAALNGLARFTHNTLPWVLIAMIALHVLAVVKHRVIDKDNILPRMWFASWRKLGVAVLTVAAITGAFAAATSYKHDMAATQIVAVADKPVAAAGNFVIDYAHSTIKFGFTHADASHSGVFNKWSASIDFDEAHPEAAKISATIDVGSAVTGDNMYDGTLPQADWLDAADFPQATYAADKVEKTGDHSYVAHGTLTLRGQTRPLDMAFNVTPAGADATATLHRLDYGVGAKSDDKADWVGRDITLTLDLAATKSN